MNRSQLHGSASALLDAHPLSGTDTAALQALLERCDQRALNPGALLCREDDDGSEVYFLLRGAVEVLKRDSKGIDRDLGLIAAPAILGHMALVDRSPRSATCKTTETTVIAALSAEEYTRVYSNAGPEGRTLRRLLLASMADQLASGNEQLRLLLSPLLDAPEGEPINEAFSEDELASISGTFQGWGPNESV